MKYVFKINSFVLSSSLYQIHYIYSYIPICKYGQKSDADIYTLRIGKLPYANAEMVVKEIITTVFQIRKKNS